MKSHRDLRTRQVSNTPVGGTSLLEHSELRGELGRGGRDSPGVEHRSGVRVRGMDKGKQQMGDNAEFNQVMDAERDGHSYIRHQENHKIREVTGIISPPDKDRAEYKTGREIQVTKDRQGS